MIRVVAKNTIKTERIEEYLVITSELIEETRKEKGCIEYVLVRDIKDLNIFTFIEKWETMEDLEAHFETPHFKRIVPMVGDLKEGELEINIYQEV